MNIIKQQRVKAALLGLFLSLPFLALGQQVLMQWDFENLQDGKCVEPATGIADTVEGNFEAASGVAGKGLRLDGFTTRVVREAAAVKTPGNEFSIEAWVALGEYPLNWCPLLTTESSEVQGYRLMLGPAGQVSLEAAIGEQWICCTSAAETMPLRKWMCLTGVYQAGKELRLYVNGELAATVMITGAVSYAAKAPAILGMVAAPGKPADIIRTWGTMADYYGLEGIVDEVKVLEGALTAEQVKARFAGVTVSTPDIPERRLPKLEKNPGHFGAFYTKLKYYPGWDNTWPVDKDADIVVCFEKSPVKVMFWRGTRYEAAWVSAKENWMTDQSVETWNNGKNDTEGCFEHMQDRHCRFSHVRLIENNEGRVVVHWRYAPVSAHDNTWRPDPKTGWEAWVDEYFTIYPDGSTLRKVAWNKGVLGPSVQYQESLPILQPGQRKTDLLEDDYVTMGDYNFNERAVPQELRKEPSDWPKTYTVQQFNFKSDDKPFICFEPGNRMFVRYVALGYNHFPVGQARCDGRWTKTLDRPSHISSSPVSNPVIHEQGNRQYWNGLYGMNRMSMKELINFGRSWAYPAALAVKGSGFTSQGYDMSQRCYQVQGQEANSGQLELTLQGSKESPIINPAICVSNWNAEKATVLVNGKPNDNCRVGFNRELSGTTLVLFVFANETGPVTITLAK